MTHPYDEDDEVITRAKAYAKFFGLLDKGYYLLRQRFPESQHKSHELATTVKHIWLLPRHVDAAEIRACFDPCRELMQDPAYAEHLLKRGVPQRWAHIPEPVYCDRVMLTRNTAWSHRPMDLATAVRVEGRLQWMDLARLIAHFEEGESDEDKSMAQRLRNNPSEEVAIRIPSIDLRAGIYVGGRKSKPHIGNGLICVPNQPGTQIWYEEPSNRRRIKPSQPFEKLHSLYRIYRIPQG